MTPDIAQEAMVSIYDDTLTARSALDAVRNLEHADLADAATVLQLTTGGIEIEDIAEMSVPTVAFAGGLVGLAMGILFPGSTLGWIAGSAAWGVLVEKVVDNGIHSDPLQDLSERLAPGMGALVTVGSPSANDRVVSSTPEPSHRIRRQLPDKALETIRSEDFGALPRFEIAE